MQESGLVNKDKGLEISIAINYFSQTMAVLLGWIRRLTSTGLESGLRNGVSLHLPRAIICV